MIIGGSVKIFDKLGTEPFRTVEKDTEAQSDYSYYVSISNDDKTFLVTKLNRLEIWDLLSRKIKKTIRDNQLALRAVCFSTDNRYIIYMRKNGEAVFLNSSTLIESHKQKLTGEKPTVICPSPDGEKLFIGTGAGNIIVYNFKTTDISSFNISRKGIYNIDFPRRTKDFIAASTDDGMIWLGNYPSLVPIKSWQAHAEGYTPISFHPSGKYIASGGKDKKIHVWKIPDCTIEPGWEEKNNMPLLSVAFSPDGTILASGSQNKLLSDATKTRSFTGSPEFISSSKNNVPISSVSNEPSKVIQPSSSPQKRLALIIGNGNYLSSYLANPENDAREMKNALVQYGFDVLEYENLNQSRMKMAMDEFGGKLKGYDVGLFFYAGHGIQSKGYNYLIPVDANLKSEEQVEYDCVQADRILAFMESSGTKVNIIILDACRNNPFERSWTRSSAGKGLAFMTAPSGSLIAYATAPGSTASDGSGNNGLYTSAILESIRTPKINILQIFQNVRKIVSEKSGGQQIPWESTSLTGDFYF
jgi:WD40 repeat protein